MMGDSEKVNCALEKNESLLTLKELTLAVSGSVLNDSPSKSAAFTSVATDSRNVVPSSLFVPHAVILPNITNEVIAAKTFFIFYSSLFLLSFQKMSTSPVNSESIILYYTVITM